jgi:hypothetical protein
VVEIWPLAQQINNMGESGMAHDPDMTRPRHCRLMTLAGRAATITPTNTTTAPIAARVTIKITGEIDDGNGF